MEHVKTNKNEVYKGKGLYEVDIKASMSAYRGKTYGDKLKNAIKDFLMIQPKKNFSKEVAK